MARFLIKYPSEKAVEESVSDCETVEQFIYSRFGSVDPAEHGVEITLVEDEPADAPTPTAPVKPAAKPKAK